MEVTSATRLALRKRQWAAIKRRERAPGAADRYWSTSAPISTSLSAPHCSAATAALSIIWRP